jgi:hypothetical protein
MTVKYHGENTGLALGVRKLEYEYCKNGKELDFTVATTSQFQGSQVDYKSFFTQSSLENFESMTMEETPFEEVADMKLP